MTLNGWKINNAPKLDPDTKYVVATWVDDSFWFYGQYSEAYKAAAENAALGEGRRIFVID